MTYDCSMIWSLSRLIILCRQRWFSKTVKGETPLERRGFVSFVGDGDVIGTGVFGEELPRIALAVVSMVRGAGF